MMKKLLFSIATIFSTHFAFGQLTLEHSFSDKEEVTVFNDGSKIYYFVKDYNNYPVNKNKIFIYNSDYSLYKEVNIPFDSIYDSGFGLSSEYQISKHILNFDDKFEFILYNYSNSLQKGILLIVNEDGEIIKNLPDYRSDFTIFHDSQKNINKIRLNKKSGSGYNIHEIYLLPTSILSTREIQGKNKLSAFPIPTNKILNILNPENGANKIEVFDASGKLVLNKNFTNSENRISVDVENLPKGIYIYKIGDLSAKFIKN